MANNLNHMMTSVNSLLFLHAAIHAKLHMPLLTMSIGLILHSRLLQARNLASNFFVWTKARKIETEMILVSFNNIYIIGPTGSK